MPLWPANGSISEEEVGRTADLCRGLAWCLTQDIYALPSTHGEIESLITTQVQTGRFIFLNDTRWAGFRSWARFLGFATGDDSSFFFDPTVAVRSELKEVIRKGETVPAAEFVSRLAVRLPVLDSGVYRLEVEQVLRPESWTAPATGHLSTALSFALRRLQKQGMIGLVTLADAGSRLTLVGQGADMGKLYPYQLVEGRIMSLLSYWPTADEINDCIKHEAEGAHDAVLLAVHKPSPLSYKQISSGVKFEASEEDLFKYLITKDVPSGVHVVPITGASGVGKSHMVRILTARLQSTNEDDRYVIIRIPKSASLRRVVELILEKLPGRSTRQSRQSFLRRSLKNSTSKLQLSGSKES